MVIHLHSIGSRAVSSALIALGLVATMAGAQQPAGTATTSATKVVLLGNRHARADTRAIGSGDGDRRQRHCLPRRLRARRGAARERCRNQPRHHGASSPPGCESRSRPTCTPTTRSVIADLIFTPWTLGRRVPLEVYGPDGPQGHDRAPARSVSGGHRDADQRTTGISERFRTATK